MHIFIRQMTAKEKRLKQKARTNKQTKR